jgi:hypothetical protein
MDKQSFVSPSETRFNGNLIIAKETFAIMYEIAKKSAVK